MPRHLTQGYVSSIRHDPEKPIWITDDEVKNLKLYVGTSGAKVWYLYYRDQNGKKASKKLGAFDVLTVAQARDMAKEVGGRILRGESVKKEKPAPKFTYGDFLRDFYEPWVVANRRTGRETMQILNSTFGFLMQQSIEDFSTLELEQWRTKRIGEGRKAATLNRLVVALKASVNWAVQHEIIKENPIARLRPLREDDSDKKIRYLSPEERKRLYAALDAREARMKEERDSHNVWSVDRKKPLLPDLKECAFVDHLKPMVIVSLNTGIRQGSLFQLRWSDIDFQEGILTVPPPAEKTGKLVHIPMNAEVTETLEAWRRQTHGKDSGLVFPSPKTGGEMNNCKSAWERLLQDADIKNFRWHDMRHDFASQLVMRGVDLNTVRELMGHADMKMTLRYAHLAPSVKAEAVKLLAKDAQVK
jgi:integrase